jgi:pyruvyl transferase EpsI
MSIKNIIKKIIFKFSFLGKKDCALIGTPTHHNIGDSKIVEAEKLFLRDKKLTFFEITYSEYLNNKKAIRIGQNKFKIILLHGGGNIGNEYLNEEEIRRDVINSFPNKRIIVLPQTIFFTNDDTGKKELKKSYQIYNNHTNLFIFAREIYSYEKYNHYFHNMFLVPDIALYARKHKYGTRKSVLFLLRNDVEKSLDPKVIDSIKKDLILNRIAFDNSDMMSPQNINKIFRNFVVSRKMKEIGKYRLVITDRLHGMVFSYLSCVPCIALSNYNYKVLGTYEWIKEDKNVAFINESSKLSISLIKKKLNAAKDETDYVDESLFDAIYAKIKEVI